MEEIITLKSREYKNYLKRLKSLKGFESRTYLLKVEHPNLIREEDPMGKIIAIEPRGGPCMKVGKALEGVGEIEFIDYTLGYGYTVTFKQ
jgi:hypothetical protein